MLAIGAAVTAPPNSPTYRGIIHFHSCYSPDSITTISRILAAARGESLDFLILTDHHAVAGSRELARRIAAQGLPLQAPLAAEYRTDHGDMIAAFLQEEVVSRRLDDFLAEVRAQGGLVLLPHPLVDHREVEMLAREADLIEVFNGRADGEANRAAEALAARFGKPGFWASDAHLAPSLTRAVVAVENRGTLKESLLAGGIRPVRSLPACAGDVLVSQAIKIIKTGDARRVVRYASRRAAKIAARLFRRGKTADG